MAEQELDALLQRMETIASAVNAFSSEGVQQAALAALISAFEVGGPSKKQRAVTADIEEVEPEDVTKPDGDAGGGPGPKVRKRKRPANGAAKPEIKAVRDLDLRPAGKQSFDDFISAKQPSDNQQKFAVTIYWLEHVLEIEPITQAHVATVFRMTQGWRESGNFASGLRQTASRKHWIDTSDLNNLRTTPHGRNFVEHDLPAKERKK